MSKRVYFTTIKRKRLLDEALLTARQTREVLGPELLEKARSAIGGAAQVAEQEQVRSIQADRVPVDQKKNLTIVMKYLELNPDNKHIHSEIRSYLSQN